MQTEQPEKLKERRPMVERFSEVGERLLDITALSRYLVLSSHISYNLKSTQRTKQSEPLQQKLSQHKETGSEYEIPNAH